MTLALPVGADDAALAGQLLAAADATEVREGGSSMGDFL
jgi:hypothetical protein